MCISWLNLIFGYYSNCKHSVGMAQQFILILIIFNRTRIICHHRSVFNVHQLNKMVLFWVNLFIPKLQSPTLLLTSTIIMDVKRIAIIDKYVISKMKQICISSNPTNIYMLQVRNKEFWSMQRKKCNLSY